MEDNAKLKCGVPKPNEKPCVLRQSEHSNSLKTNKRIALHNDSSQFTSSDSPVKRVLLEANKIIKIGLAKEIALFDKDATIQNSNETIENLRRNILKLQMEYEKLDQNYQNEISQRYEITKRMEMTRSIAESAAQYCNVLVKSVKELEDDKHKLAEFYEMIMCNQEDIEEKHKNVEKQIKHIDNLLVNEFNTIKEEQEKMTLKNIEILAERDRELSNVNEKLEIISNEKENLTKNIAELKSSNSLQQKSINKLKLLIKTIRINNLKQKKLWINKKSHLLNIREKYKKTLNNLQNVQASFAESLSLNNVLEKDKNELKREIEEQKVTFQNLQKKWEADKDELIKTLQFKKKDMEELKISNAELIEKISEFEKKTMEQTEREKKEKFSKDQLQENYFQILEENRTLKASNNELNDQILNKTQLILDFESKLTMYDNDFKSRKSFFKIETEKYEEIVKSLELKITNLDKKLSAEKAQNEKLTGGWEKLQVENNSFYEKITFLDKELKEKLSVIEALQSEKKETECLSQSLKTENQELKNLQLFKETMINNLKEDCLKIKINNEELMKSLKNEQAKTESLNAELQMTKTRLTELDKQLKDEHLSKETLKAEKNQLERMKENLMKEIEDKRRAFEELKLIKTKLEDELKNFLKVSEENLNMKAMVSDLKNRLQEAEDRIEGFKVLIKQLENNKIENRGGQNREKNRTKTEFSFLQDSMTKDGNNENHLKNTSRCEEELLNDVSSIKKLWEKVKESMSMPPLEKHENKENEAIAGDAMKPQHGSKTPIHNNKRFLSTPRKILTTTPQSRVQNLTPTKKKRDPYEFDSDGSLDPLDADTILRSTNSRSKKDSFSKKLRTKNF